MSVKVYESITERILTQLEAGVIPWRKEWRTAGGGSGIPTNYITGKPYRGMNVFTLMWTRFSSRQWMTYKQAQGIGGQVRKGEHGEQIVFWNFVQRADKTTGEDKSIPFLKTYTVFNTEQIDGLPVALPFDAPAFDPIASAAALVDAFMSSASHPTLAHGGGEAYFMPSKDHVQMPVPESFTSPGAYYATLYHELAHSTSIPSRLDRRDPAGHKFGNEAYSKEELVAEFASAFLCAEAGIINDERMANSAAYIQGWMRALRNDKTLALAAAQKAQKAADFILLRKWESGENEGVAA